MAHKSLHKLLRNGFLSTDIRNAYIQQFRDVIGEHVYIGRVPQSVNVRYACVITPINTVRQYNTAGETDMVTRRVQVDIYGNAFDAATKTEQCAEWLRMALSSYQGVLEDIETQHCYITREALTSDGSVGGDGTAFRYSTDWEITYWQTVTLVTE